MEKLKIRSYRVVVEFDFDTLTNRYYAVFGLVCWKALIGIEYL